MTKDLEALKEREKNILAIAQRLLDISDQLDEATIDSQFLYRFDPSWYRSMSEIRHLIWSLMGQENDKPLTRENEFHRRWILHINDNRGISVGWHSAQGRTVYNTLNGRSGYDPFNKELSDQFKELDDNEEKLKQVWAEMCGEANQISKIHDRINRLGQAYGVVPISSEINDYSPNQVEELYRKVFDWIVWGQIAPVFRWPMTRLIKNKVEGVSCTLWPHKMPLDQTKPGKTKGMGNPVRIRTWTIYYLTRRGSGKRTEESAIDLWNQKFSKYATATNNFRRERKKLLCFGSQKTASNDQLNMGLSWWGEIG